MTMVPISVSKFSSAVDLTGKITSVMESLVDLMFFIPQYQHPDKWAGEGDNQLFADIAVHKNNAIENQGAGHGG